MQKRFFKDITTIIAIVSIIAGLAVSTVLGNLDSERKLSIRRASVLSELSTRRAKLEGIISSTFNITQGVVYIISHQGNISPELFNALTSNAMADNPHIRNVVLAPGNVVTMVYPYKGNERRPPYARG
jgi:sensor domain CHASE-containing protein